MSAISEALSMAAPWSWVCAAAALVALISTVVATALQLRRDARGGTGLVFALPIASLVALICACLVGVARGRALIEGAALAPAGDAELRATAMAHGVGLQLNLLAMNGSLLVAAGGLAALGWLAASLARARREKLPALPALLWTGALAGPPLIATYLCLPYLVSVVHAFAQVAALDVADKTRFIAETLARGYAQLDGARPALAVAIAAAAVTAPIAAAAQARAGRVASNRALAAAAILFVVGAAAFARTRGAAFDAAHLLPVYDDGLGASAAFESAPRSETCARAPEQGPILLFGDPTRLDGRPVTPDEFVDQVTTLRNNFKLLHPTSGAPETAALLVGAPDFAAARAAPFLQAALRQHYDHLALITIKLRSTSTRTIGELARPSACAWPIVLAADGAPLTKFGRWAELVDAATRAGAPPRIAP